MRNRHSTIPGLHEHLSRHLARESDRIRVRLEWPIEYDGKTYTNIFLRRALVGDCDEILRLTGNGAARSIGERLVGLTEVVAIFADVPAEVIAALDVDDLVTCLRRLPDIFAHLEQKSRQILADAIPLTRGIH